MGINVIRGVVDCPKGGEVLLQRDTVLQQIQRKGDYRMSKEKVVRLPMNCSEVHLKNKKCDFKTLAIMTLYSCFETSEDEPTSAHRYIYRNKIIELTDEIEELSQNTIKTIKRNIKKLADLDNALVNVYETDDGKIVYKINYQLGEFVENDKGFKEHKNGAFVQIEQSMLKFLIDVGNNNVIKTYVLLQALCENEARTSGCKEKWVTREFIAEHIGLSTKCKNNLDLISNITDMLRDIDFIDKRSVVFRTDNGQTRTHVYYRIVSYEEWKKRRLEKKEKDTILVGKAK